jgi:hypothetical protein
MSGSTSRMPICTRQLRLKTSSTSAANPAQFSSRRERVIAKPAAATNSGRLNFIDNASGK